LPLPLPGICSTGCWLVTTQPLATAEPPIRHSLPAAATVGGGALGLPAAGAAATVKSAAPSTLTDRSTEGPAARSGPIPFLRDTGPLLGLV
jgi:hypothetical protein